MQLNHEVCLAPGRHVKLVPHPCSDVPPEHAGSRIMHKVGGAGISSAGCLPAVLVASNVEPRLSGGLQRCLLDAKWRVTAREADW